MSIFDGIELTDEQKAAVQANVDKMNEGLVARTELDAVIANRDEILAEKKSEQEKRRLQEEEATKKAAEAQAAKGDAESLKSFYEDQIEALKSQINDFQEKDKTQTIGSVADDFVNQNVVDDSFIKSSIKSEIMKRLDVRDGKTVVLSADGQLTGMTTADLFNEFKGSAQFQPHLVANKAAGSGAAGSQGQGGASGKALAEKSTAEAGTKEEKTAIVQARLDAAGL